MPVKINIHSIFLCVAMLLFGDAFSQVSDEFSDGDFLLNPIWVGDIDSFQVTAGELRNKGNGAGNGKSSLVTGNTVISNAEWRISVKFNFNPSASNFCRFYLVSDQPDLKGNLSGYYVQLGGSTGSTDTISLYRQNGSVRTRIIGGRAGTVAKTQNSIDLRVTRDSVGTWSLYSDTALSGFFYLEGRVLDSTIKSSMYSGVYCQYTTSNSQGFFFDNFYAGSIQKDSLAPVFDSVIVLNANSIECFFSENLDQTTSEDVQNYIANMGLGSPTTAVLLADKKSILLTFASGFPVGQSILLTADGIKDISGNISGSQTRSFLFYEVQERDVLINELFADPLPQVGLPNGEFVELHNRSNYSVNLSGWTLGDGTNMAILPNFVLRPDSFVILCPAANTNDYLPYGTTIGLSAFPSLNNSGDNIVLRNSSSMVIDEVNYLLSWYNDASKDDGGWSLELINPNHPCSGASNWSSSNNVQGGTPGTKNSVYSSVLDITPPQIKTHEVINSGTLLVLFDEHIDTIASTGFTVTITNGITAVVKKISGVDNDSLMVTVSPALISGTTYQVSISGIKDCWGNSLSSGGFVFKYIIPVEAVNYGVLIDEIYADESPSYGLPATEYIELYNNMNGSVNLDGWTLSDGSLTVRLPKLILEPDSFIVICPFTNVGFFSGYSNIIGVSGFPSLGNDGDLLVLRDYSAKVIHSVEYSSTWYRDNIKKNGGWSLEMRDVNNPCGGITNWSASIADKGGTPGKVNSVKASNPDLGKPAVLGAYPISVNELVLVLSEPIDTVSALSLGGYICNKLSFPVKVSFPFASNTRVVLTFSDSIKEKTIYTIKVDSIRDCSGNFIDKLKNTARFGMYEQPDSLDILINEILFNPFTGGSDFVELYNNSTKIINVNDIFIANTDANNSINDYYRVLNEPVLLFPYEYLSITEDKLNVETNYRQQNSDRIRQTLTLPGFSDNEGVVVLMDSIGRRFDQFSYSSDYHNPFVDTKDGVSLERIDFSGATQDKNNWTSASATSGFATPGYQNSQFHQLNRVGSVFKLQSESFSPDGDGNDDQMLLMYTTDYAGYSCSIQIFNDHGYLVKKLLRNEVLGTEGVIKWDGDTESGSKVQTGIYIIYIELVNAKGERKELTKTIVAAAKL